MQKNFLNLPVLSVLSLDKTRVLSFTGSGTLTRLKSDYARYLTKEFLYIIKQWKTTFKCVTRYRTFRKKRVKKRQCKQDP